MRDYTPSGFFVLRTPLFPFQEFLNFSRELSVPAAIGTGGDLAAATANDRSLLRSRLMEIARRSEVREALWVASPEFFDSLSAWLEKPAAKEQKIEHSFYRYLARMTSRPTPFGLFAGCSVGRIGEETRFELGPRGQYYRRSRLDMEYLYNLADKIAADPALRAHVSFRPNTSVYMAADRYHHVQGYLAEKIRLYRLIATEHTPYLEATLLRAQAGATPEELAAALVRDDPEVSMEEATAYVGQLIDSQLLVADVVPPITGPEPIDDMIAQLRRTETAALATSLSAISERLQKLDAGGIGHDPAEYQRLTEAARELPVEFQVEHLVQVDMMKPSPLASMDRRLVAELLRGVELLYSIQQPPGDAFQQFKSDFQERYQGQEIPLVLALDEEVGIGFEKRDGPGALDEPLIENLDLAPGDDDSDYGATFRDALLLRKLEELARSRGAVLELDDKLLEALRVKDLPPLPDAFAVMAVLGGPSAPGGKPSVYLQTASGPSGAILLGRFCHADPSLTEFVKKHMCAEEALREASGAVFAEVVHLPEGRIGNVLFRPTLRKYEIPFLATSRVPVEDQIPVTDLLVSVRSDRVVLRSRRLGREVVPRLTSAHGYMHSRNLKIYKFLCMLQAQGLTAGLAWNWGFLDQAAFLPRVARGNIVLSLARWRVEKATIQALAREHGHERLRAVHQWRTEAGIPRFVLLSESDNQLLIDFENALSVETLIEYVKNRTSIWLTEMFPGPDALQARGPEGEFTHEIVVPFVRIEQKAAVATAATAQATERPAGPSGATERRFLPGSEWIYARIYCSPAQADRLLLETIRPLVETVMASGDADRWFFIRYGDPQWHLRLRFHGQPERLSGRVLPQLRQALEQHARHGSVSRMEIDTYERETERYGGPACIETAERLFQIDSALAIELLASIPDLLGSPLRWQLAFAGVDQLLTSLGFDTAARKLIVNNMGKSQEKNFQVDQHYRKKVSDRFRAERQYLEKLLAGPAGGEFPETALAALQSYAESLKEIREELERKQQAGELTCTIQELAGSFVHMHLNRLFRSAPNAQEMVLYDFLARSYDSRLAREKHKAP